MRLAHHLRTGAFSYATSTRRCGVVPPRCCVCAALVVAQRLFSTPGKVTVHVKTVDGTLVEFPAPLGSTLMEAIRDVGLFVEVCCSGTMACTTCHVYVEGGWCSKLPPASVGEMDMLDIALHPKENSRLACQIALVESLDGLVVSLPPSTINLMNEDPLQRLHAKKQQQSK